VPQRLNSRTIILGPNTLSRVARIFENRFSA